ncbi:MAG: hypothetical protein BWY99_02617 [Synergistetes bacterium ADurb.BinA166]|nr:MAG: hypothetical protein BWY99_02617 [Synergistetes bacterium ADurb.BinA166]
MSSLVYFSGSAMAVGSSMFMREAKLPALPSWGVADRRIRVSDLEARRRASLALWERAPPLTATLWASSMMIMSHQAFSRNVRYWASCFRVSMEMMVLS